MAADPLAGSLSSPSRPAGGRSRASASVTSVSVRRLRLSWGWARFGLMGLCAASIVGVLALAVGSRTRTVHLVSASASVDRAEEGFAAQFARTYLTWNAGAPAEYARRLGPFVGADQAADVGMVLPRAGAEQVSWTQVVQRRDAGGGGAVYTVAAQTDAAGLLYLTVPVRRRDGLLELGGYPALVGGPQSTAAHVDDGEDAPAIDDPAVRQTVTRALTNYLAGSAENLRADLAAGANVSLPAWRLHLEEVRSLVAAPGGGAVLALVTARDERGAEWTLRYELDVTRSGGRPLIQAIQMDPTR